MNEPDDNIDLSGDRRRRWAAHWEASQERWLQARNRRVGEEGYREEWYDQQCFDCAYYTPLFGEIGADFGVCSNAATFDGRVRFEHDGCEAYMLNEDYHEPPQG